MIYLLTGQPGAGKTSIGEILATLIKNLSIQIDGDEIRRIFDNEDYSPSGRKLNIRRAFDIALFFDNKGFDVVISMVLPYRELRDELKAKTNVTEIYIHTNNERGREHYFVPDYQEPKENFIDLDTTDKTVVESYTILLSKIREREA